MKNQGEQHGGTRKDDWLSLQMMALKEESLGSIITTGAQDTQAVTKQ
jgi:hypothetical protein